MNLYETERAGIIFSSPEIIPLSPFNEGLKRTIIGPGTDRGVERTDAFMWQSVRSNARTRQNSAMDLDL